MECIRIIKTLYLRNQKRVMEGKKSSSNDLKYLHLAEETLYREFALSLQMDKEEVQDFITNRITLLENI